MAIIVCTYDPKSRRWRGTDGKIYHKKHHVKNIRGEFAVIVPDESGGADKGLIEVNLIGRAVARVKAFVHRS